MLFLRCLEKECDLSAFVSPSVMLPAPNCEACLTRQVLAMVISSECFSTDGVKTTDPPAQEKTDHFPVPPVKTTSRKKQL